MDRDFIYPVLRCVLAAELDSLQRGTDVAEIRACIFELRFLNVCLWWFSRYDKAYSGEENWKDLKSMLDSIACTWENLVGDEIEEVGWKYVGDEQDMKIPQHLSDVWEEGSSEIEEAIEECKLHIREHSAKLSNFTFKNRPAHSADEALKFLHDVLQHLKRCIAGEAVGLKEQIEALEEKFVLLHTFFKLIPDDCVLEVRDFRTGLYDDINKVAWLTFFFWANAGDEEIEAELNLLISEMSQKIIKPSGPDTASWYFAALKSIRLQRSEDALLLGQAVPALLGLLFDHVGVEDFQILRDELIILFTFLANPPKDHAEDAELLLILDQLGDLLCRKSGSVPLVDDTKKVLLNNFMMKVAKFKENIRTLHCLIPDLSSSNFPRTNGVGFIGFLLQNLKDNLNGDKMFIPFAKHLITKIEQELASLSPDLSYIFELQKEHKELQDTWLQLINLAYLTERAVNSCSVILHPVWYNMVRLEYILDEIKVIKGKLDSVKHSDFYNAAAIPKSVRSKDEIPTQAWNSKANEAMVGCGEEIDAIIDQLTRGPKSLQIVSIVGMAGSGKTALARKVYNSQQVRRHFHIFAFCTVSQVYTTRKLLLEILKEMNGGFVDEDSKMDDDLAHQLYKQLTGKSYLIVMDDIWMIDAWMKVKSSFPDESEGSRVIFTTREGEVARIGKSPHSKQLLTDQESWELLLQAMAISQAGCPPDLSQVGKVIARNCKGLPLAVTVIGGVLARKERSLKLWNEIAEKTSSFAAEEGCMKVLELSYMHLPEHLKSCFLYLGVFSEDELIRSKRLMLLWIAEGFVQKPETERVEIVAIQYLSELVDRSLVHVAARSSSNGIKTCQLHDVIRDFCQRKAQEENIFQQIHGIQAYNSSHSHPYRLSVNMEWEAFLDTEHRDPGVKSLLYLGRRLSEYDCDGRESIFTKFQLAQVLDLENVFLTGAKDQANRVLESVISLAHLRYLAISIFEKHIPFPSGIADLKNLETLIIQRRDEFWCSDEILGRMEKLKYLAAGRCNLIPCAPKLEAYPLLYNLECFSTLVLTSTTANTLLKRLQNLRKLSCVLHGGFAHDSIFGLDVLIKLESLKVTLVDKVNVIFPTTLKKLSVKTDRLPSKLGDLPCLEVLKIDGNHDQRWDVEDGEFPMLKFLKLQHSHLKEWNVSDGSFPCLEQLFVDCYDLDEIPAIFRESTTLKRIGARSWNPDLTRSAYEVQDEQIDLGNEIQLVVSDPWQSSGEEDD